MIKEIGKRFSVDLSQVYGVGDALRDLQAFADASCQPILVRTGKGESTLSAGDLPVNTIVFADLSEAAQYIIAENN